MQHIHTIRFDTLTGGTVSLTKKTAGEFLTDKEHDALAAKAAKKAPLFICNRTGQPTFTWFMDGVEMGGG